MIEINDNGQKVTAGRRIKMARTLAGLSRKDLEEKFGISMHTLQSWELGRNPLTDKAASRLVEILHATGISCSMQWLLEGAGKSPSLLGSEFTPYPSLHQDIAPLLGEEAGIQNEIEFFKKNNPNAVVIMVSDDAMEPRYSKGDFVGGSQYFIQEKINACVGNDCIIELSDGIYFRRLIQRKNGYALVSLNPQTETDEPVIFTKHVLAATPIIWHRWRFKAE